MATLDRTQQSPVRPSPIQLDMWEVELRAQTADARGRANDSPCSSANFCPVRSESGKRTAEEEGVLRALGALLANGGNAELKQRIVGLIVARATDGQGVNGASIRSEESMNKILEMVMATPVQPPAANASPNQPGESGRHSIEKELLWAERRRVETVPDFARPSAPVPSTVPNPSLQGLPSQPHFQRHFPQEGRHREGGPTAIPRPKPVAQRSGLPNPTIQGKRFAKMHTLQKKAGKASTVTRSASSAFSDCSYGSFTGSSASKPEHEGFR